jgi:hypothetical protein
VDHGQKHQPLPNASTPAQSDGQRFVGNGVEHDREWARARLSRALGAPIMRKAQPIAGWGEHLGPDPNPFRVPIQLKKKGGAAPAQAPPARNDLGRVDEQRRRQRQKEVEPKEPIPQALPFKPLGDKQEKEIKAKVASRTASKEESERYDWHQRFKRFRARGVDRMWAEEAAALEAGKPGSRNWSPEQKAAILKGDKPKGPDGSSMIGHHKHNAATYPQMGGDPKNVAPVTKKEHLERWHGGNTRTPTHGQPLDPNSPEEF